MLVQFSRDDMHNEQIDGKGDDDRRQGARYLVVVEVLLCRLERVFEPPLNQGKQD